jgi:transcriptional regulator with XRE-family HTH domain
MSLGARLQLEREKRSISLDEMARATEIRREYLDALEQDAFDQLRGPAFGKLYIRAYAEKLGFDPAPLLEEYERAVRQRAAAARSSPKRERLRPVQSAVARWREARIAEHDTSETVEAEPAPPEPFEPEPPLEAEALEPEPPQPEPLETQPTAPEPLHGGAQLVDLELVAEEAPQPSPNQGLFEPNRPPPDADATAHEQPTTIHNLRATMRRLAWVATALALAILAIRGIRWLGDAPDPAVPAPVPAPVQPMSPTTVDRPVDVATERSIEPAPTVEPTPSPRAARPSRLSVTESAVGSRVGGRFVAGDRFRKGQVAAFETRVVGGRRGDQIRHVWKWGGRRMQTIALRVGSSQWRTFSTKTLNAAGAWTVEAHDASGTVLASAEFVASE